MNKIKKILMAVTLLLGIVVISGNPVYATTVKKAGSATYLNSKYVFTPRFIDGKTTCSYAGMTNKKADHWLGVYGEIDEDFDATKNIVSARISSDSQKGNIVMRYKNVGSYNGDVIDLRITLLGWTTSQAKMNGTEITDGVNAGQVSYPTVFFRTDRIEVAATGYSFRNMKWKFQFLKNGSSDTEIEVPFHANFEDIDNSEYLKFSSSSGADGVYIKSNSQLSISSDSYKASSLEGSQGYDEAKRDSDPKYWATIYGKGAFNFIYGRGVDDDADFTKPMSKNNRAYYLWSFTQRSVVPFNTPEITKKIIDAKGNIGTEATIYSDEEFAYEIYMNVPHEESTYYYDSLKIVDNIPDELEIIGEPKIETDDGTPIGDTWITTTKSGNRITFESVIVDQSKFYGKNFIFHIDVKKKNGASLSKYQTGSSVPIVPNTAIIYTKRAGETTSDDYTANAKFYHLIKSSVKNGTIGFFHSNGNTIEKSGETWVSAASTVEYFYEPDDHYVIKSVKVDGKSVSISDYKSSYTFTNLRDDHTIDVIFQPETYNVQTNIRWQHISGKYDAYEVIENSKQKVTYQDPYWYTWTRNELRDEPTNVYEDVDPNPIGSASITGDKNFYITVNRKKYTYTFDENPPVGHTVDEIGNKQGNLTDQYAETQSGSVSKPTLDGYRFVEWNTKKDGSGTKYKDEKMLSNKKFYAQWKLLCNINTSVNGGTIDVPITSVDEGTTHTIHYAPNEGYYLRKLLVDGTAVDITKYPSSYTFKNISKDHTIHAEFLPQPILTIHKKINADEAYFPSGDPTFIFKITGTDFLGTTHTLHRMVKFTKNEVVAGTINKQIEISGKELPAGTYTVSEIETARYVPTLSNVVSGTKSGVTATLNTDGQNASCTFTNTRKKYDYFDHNDIAVNHFAK